MYLSELIHKEIKAIDKQQTVESALKTITKYQLTHLPIVADGYVEGMISEECLLLMEEEDVIANAEKHFQKFQLSINHLLLDTFKVFHTFDSNIIPIVNEKEVYQGMLLMEDVVTYFSKFPFISENGAVLILEMSSQSYSMAEIGRIVESHNAKLFGSMITEMNTEQVQVTLKISSENLSSIGETFERYGYTVIHKYYEDKKEELLEDRYKQLQQFLNV